MALQINLRQAKRLDDWIERHFTGLSGPSHLRGRMAGAGLVAALHHYTAIVLLIDEKKPSSAFALSRVIWESYLKGLWLLECAAEDALTPIITGGRQFPKLQTMANEIEKLEGYKESRILSQLQWAHAETFNDFTHMGARQLQRWNTEASIEPNFSEVEQEEVLAFAGMIALFACSGLATLAVDPVKMMKANRRFHTLTRNSKHAVVGPTARARSS